MKAQVSVEFLAIALVVLIFILAFFVSAFGKQTMAQDIEKQKKIENICSDVANKINSAVYFGFGFTQNVSLPEQIYGLNYSITVYNGTLLCRYDKYVIIEKFITNSTTNTTHDPPFELPRREIKIENSAGIIVIS